MLYVTTRNCNDAYTAYRTLHSDTAPDGGMYVPFRIPTYTADELEVFSLQSFSQTVSGLLNIFFSAGIDSWTVDLCVGRNLTKLVPLGQKICAAEIWHNSASNLEYVISSLYKQISGEYSAKPTDWFCIAARIAVIFGVYSEMLTNGTIAKDQVMDVSVRADDPYMPAAVLYAKQMGLPISAAVFACTENSAVWDLFYRGQCSFINPAHTSDKLRTVERLVSCALGAETVKSLISAADNHSIFSVDEQSLPQLQNGVFVAAVGETRLHAVINSIMRTDNFVISEKTAYSLGGLQDYRASTGEGRFALIFVEQAP